MGVRVHWEEVPGSVRAALEARVGAPIVEAITQPQGFSPGLATRLRLDDGRWSGFDSWACLLRFASTELHPATTRWPRMAVGARAPVDRVLRMGLGGTVGARVVP